MPTPPPPPQSVSGLHIAVIHGYFLEGTGSNLYVQNLCREFCRLGHRVSLFCQESCAERFSFVSSAVHFSPDNRHWHRLFSRSTGLPVSCTCLRPNIHNFLPVYVRDEYHGYKVRLFHELSPEEIEQYLTANATALHSWLTPHPPDLIISNHCIMQPVYTRRALRHAPHHVITPHGSALNFSVRHSPLLQQYAREGLNGAAHIVCASTFAKKEFLSFFADDNRLAGRTRVFTPGVDVERFRPLRSRDEMTGHLDNLLSLIRTGAQDPALRNDGCSFPVQSPYPPPPDNSWIPAADAAHRLAAIPWGTAPVILFLGRLLHTKGPHLLLAAAPLILQHHPDTVFIIAGTGPLYAYLRHLVQTLHEDHRKIIRDILGEPPLSDRLEAEVLDGLRNRLADPAFARNYFAAARGRLGDQVIFTGYLDHEQLQHLLPCTDITVAPSIFPETFGLVAIESLAAGVIPVQTNFSGFRDVIHTYVHALRSAFPSRKLPALHPDQQLIFHLAQVVCELLSHYKTMSAEERTAVREEAHQLAVEHYSWHTLARRYLSLFPHREPSRHPRKT